MNFFKRFNRKKNMPSLEEQCRPYAISLKESLSAFDYIYKEVECFEKLLNDHKINIEYSWETPEIPADYGGTTTLLFHWMKESNGNYCFRLGKIGSRYPIKELKIFYLKDIHRLLPEFIKEFAKNLEIETKDFPALEYKSTCHKCNKEKLLLCSHCLIYYCRFCNITSQVLKATDGRE